MKDNPIIRRILNASEEKRSVREALAAGKRKVLVTGLHAAQRLELCVYLMQQGRRQMMVYSSDREAIAAHKSLVQLGLRACLIKAQDLRFYAVEAKNKDEEGALIESLFLLSRAEFDVCVISAEALMAQYAQPQSLSELAFELEVGACIDPDQLTDRLVQLGYTREHKVEGVGMFAMRGGIMDIFTPGSEHPLRVELFDDEIDSIRSFDVFTQKSIEKFNRIEVLPAKAWTLPHGEEAEQGLLRIEQDMTLQTGEDIRFDLERLRAGQYFPGAEKYIGYFYDQNTIFSYLPDDTLIVLNDPARIIERIEGAHEEFKDSYINALAKGYALKGQGRLLLAPEELIAELDRYPNLYNNTLQASIKHLHTDALIDIETRESQSFQGKLMAFLEELSYLRSTGYLIIISLQDPHLIAGIQRLLKEHNLAFVSDRAQLEDIRIDTILFTDQYFAGGSIYTKQKLAIFTKNEIYSPQKATDRKFTQKVKTKKIESFIELKQGDYVVHEAYGIGRFLAVEQKEFDGVTKDYIKIAYGAGDSLYLPLEQMSKIQRYIGNMKEDGIRLSKLGGNEWKTTKKKAKKIVDLIAQDLVDLYAKRENETGHPFAEDTPWQKEFEEDFPFTETQDQLRAIADVKADMESNKIMDRLLCGDVGYGKTEVALRAVFKAVMDGKQAAFLVPTTVLAKQHYDNFVERFAHFPIRVALLSRYRTAKEQEQEHVIEQLRTGEVDVLIGTHRILSKDIAFRDLGLIVVDEEQRFGVKDKEKLKSLRANCDVLALSATPIPRTLHMSLSGIRDISTLEEPPLERLPILTYVMEAREGIISDAIMREINRGGQVYFVYNRVQSIDQMHAQLTKLLPGVTIAAAHGQMPPRKLEKVLEAFTQKQYDVLLCTTIIETGMDIGNANTMIVYGADRMGLSQLYQLRGRVGRTSRQGYAYFMYEKDRVLNEVAEKRLKTIKEFTEFGSGFKVAMRDLEIRGAGTLLGETQHGHIADIGYELYVKMLEDAITRLRGQEVEEDIETEIAIKVNGYIPSDYIENEMDKIEIYKKIAAIRDLEDKRSIEEEIEDRFSDIPFSVYTLTEAAYIRSLGRKLKIGRIAQMAHSVNFYDPAGKLIVKKDFGRLEDYKLLTSIAKYLEAMV